MLRKIPVIIMLISVLITLSSCDNDKDSSKTKPTEVPTENTHVTLTVSGSGGTTRVLEAVKAAFETDVPTHTLDILTGTGTGGGVQGVTEGVLDIAAMARPPKPEELEAAPGFQYVEFGLSGQAIFVPADATVTELTSKQVKDIFFGEVTNWSEIGGPDQSIIVYVRDEGDTSTSVLRDAIFGDTPFPESATVKTSQGDMIAAVEGTPGAIGFGTWPAVLAANAKVKAITLDGVAPGDPAYTMTASLGIGYLAERENNVRPLADWLLSEKGKAALLKLEVIVTQ